MKTPKIPKGWTILNDGLTRSGDKYYSNERKKWIEISDVSSGGYVQSYNYPIRKPRKGKKELKSEAARLDLEYLNAMHDQIIEQKRQLRDILLDISTDANHQPGSTWAALPMRHIDRAREILKQTK